MQLNRVDCGGLVGWLGEGLGKMAPPGPTAHGLRLKTVPICYPASPIRRETLKIEYPPERRALKTEHRKLNT